MAAQHPADAAAAGMSIHGLRFLNEEWNDSISNGDVFTVRWNQSVAKTGSGLGVFKITYPKDGVVVYELVSNLTDSIDGSSCQWTPQSLDKKNLYAMWLTSGQDNSTDWTLSPPWVPKESTNHANTPWAAPFIIPVICLLAVYAASLTGYLVYRRRKKAQNEKEDSKPHQDSGRSNSVDSAATVQTLNSLEAGIEKRSGTPISPGAESDITAVGTYCSACSACTCASGVLASPARPREEPRRPRELQPMPDAERHDTYAPRSADSRRMSESPRYHGNVPKTIPTNDDDGVSIDMDILPGMAHRRREDVSPSEVERPHRNLHRLHEYGASSNVSRLHGSMNRSRQDNVSQDPLHHRRGSARRPRESSINRDLETYRQRSTRRRGDTAAIDAERSPVGMHRSRDGQGRRQRFRVMADAHTGSRSTIYAADDSDSADVESLESSIHHTPDETHVRRPAHRRLDRDYE